MTRDLLRAGREAREGDGRHIKAAEGAELLFRADGGVTEAGGHRRCRCEAVVIVRHRDAKLGSRQQSVADERLRQVHHGAVCEIGCEQAVLHLEAALRDDHAGIGDRGTIGGDGRQEILSKIQHLHARALAAAEAAPSPERAAALRLFAANLHKAFYPFEPDFFHNLLRIVDDAVSVIKGSLQLWPTLVEISVVSCHVIELLVSAWIICYFQKGRKGLRTTRVNNRSKSLVHADARRHAIDREYASTLQSPANAP
jgi:hypothetical protein